jgi:hypothetical protein
MWGRYSLCLLLCFGLFRRSADLPPSGLAVRRHPPLAQVKDRMHRQHKILHPIGLVAFKRDPAGAATGMTRSWMLMRGRTLPRPRRLPRRLDLAGSVAVSMPLGLISGWAFRPFNRAISARSSP